MYLVLHDLNVKSALRRVGLHLQPSPKYNVLSADTDCDARYDLTKNLSEPKKIAGKAKMICMNHANKKLA